MCRSCLALLLACSGLSVGCGPSDFEGTNISWTLRSSENGQKLLSDELKSSKPIYYHPTADQGYEWRYEEDERIKLGFAEPSAGSTFTGENVLLHVWRESNHNNIEYEVGNCDNGGYHQLTVEGDRYGLTWGSFEGMLCGAEDGIGRVSISGEFAARTTRDRGLGSF